MPNVTNLQCAAEARNNAVVIAMHLLFFQRFQLSGMLVLELSGRPANTFEFVPIFRQEMHYVTLAKAIN